MEEELQYWRKYGSGIYPSISINNKTFRGNIDPLSVYNAICAGFLNPPEICKETLGIVTPIVIHEIKKEAKGMSWGGIILIVILVIMFNGMVIYCYRRQTKREA